MSVRVLYRDNLCGCGDFEVEIPVWILIGLPMEHRLKLTGWLAENLPAELDCR